MCKIPGDTTMQGYRGKRQLPKSTGTTPEKPPQKERSTRNGLKSKRCLLFNPDEDFPVNTVKEVLTVFNTHTIWFIGPGLLVK